MMRFLFQFPVGALTTTTTATLAKVLGKCFAAVSSCTCLTVEDNGARIRTGAVVIMIVPTNQPFSSSSSSSPPLRPTLVLSCPTGTTKFVF